MEDFTTLTCKTEHATALDVALQALAAQHPEWGMVWSEFQTEEEFVDQE